MAQVPDIYTLSRHFWDFSFRNPEMVRPTHAALFFFAVDLCNRLGWKEKFGLPTTMAKEAIGIGSYNTYVAAFRDLVDWGFFALIEKSKNQYSSNIIALSKNDNATVKATDEPLDKALIQHVSKQLQYNKTSIQINNPTKSSRFTPPTLDEVMDYVAESNSQIDPQYFIDYYTANGWKVGKSPMKDWKATLRNWAKNETKFKHNGQNIKQQPDADQAGAERKNAIMQIAHAACESTR